MIITNCKIIFHDRIEVGTVRIKDNKIVSINPTEINDDEILDSRGMYLSPGFIDIHIHGASGLDVMDGDYHSINGISKAIAKHGTTSFLPTTMTCNVEDIKRAILAVSDAKKNGTEGSQILGVHLEGPFISPFMVGAQNPKYIKNPLIETFKQIVGEQSSIITSITLAPEVDGAKEFIKYLCEQGIVISIGHSKANYSEAIEGINCGISHSTHLFNAMTGFHHREAGIVGAIFDTDITTEVISDGIHICYPSLRVAFKQKTIDKVILITDAMMACSMPEGEYSLGNQIVYVSNGTARLENGALAGSVLTLDRAIKNVYENTSYELFEIIKMVTYNPAKHCKVEHRKGLIKEGYDADLVLFDEDINIDKVIIGGKIIKEGN